MLTESETPTIAPTDPLEGFVPFSRGGRSTAQPLVTLRKGGGLGFGSAVFEALGSPAAVELLWHRQRRVIALRAADPTNPDTCTVTKPGKAQSYLINAGGFLRWAGIELDATWRYAPDIQGHVLLIDLNQEPLERVAGARGGKRRERQPAGA